MIEITDKTKCTGCYACFSICPKNCIAMECDDEGFWYPEINKLLCDNCGLCEKHCPVLSENINNNLPVSYAAYNKNEEVRLKSSSGGIFMLIAESIVAKGGVVFGAAFDENFNVFHTHAENKEQLSKFRGSKYVQSKIGNAYIQAKEFLKLKRMILFTGTPCQIVGLKEYLGKNYENLITQDIVCHGVPSQKVWQLYRKTICKDNKQVGMNFRDKTNGWNSYSFRYEFDNGNYFLESKGKSGYAKGFINSLFLRPSCYKCKFKGINNRYSDITLGDFWGIKQLMPEMNDEKGTSMVIVNTDKGKKLFEEISDSCVIKKVDINKAVVYNKCAVEPSKTNSKRKIFFKELGNTSIEKLIAKYYKYEKLKVFPYRCYRKIKSILKK